MMSDNLLFTHLALPELESEGRAPAELPDWRELTQLNYRPSPDDYPARVARLKKPLHWFLRAGGEIFYKLFLRDPTFTKFLDYGWHEVVDLMADQVVRNRALLDAGLTADQLAPYSQRRLLRNFHQQPCTRETVLRRVDVIEQMATHEQPVLLLGDDDLVSVELARRGFCDVTVLDIDQSVLDEIRREAMSQGLQLKLQRHDFNEPPPPQLCRDYAVVFFDPIYSIDGTGMFLRAARTLTAGRPGTRYFICAHLLSLMSDGVPKLSQLLEQEALQLVEFRQGFNIYPTLRRVKFLVQIVNLLLLGSSTTSVRYLTIPYIFSDALLLEQR